MTYLISLIITFIGCLFLVLRPLELAKSNNRSMHTSDIPTSGGIGLFIGFMITIIYEARTIPYVLIILGIIFIIGVLDDKSKLSSISRFIIQIFISITSIYLVGGLMLHPILFVISVIFMTYLINAYNFMDGIDSILTLQSLFYLTTILIFLNEYSPWLTSIQIMIGALVAFMFFNFHPAKLFMGNSGSYFIGAYISILMISIHLSAEINILTSLILITTIIGDTAYAIIRRFIDKLISIHEESQSIIIALTGGVKYVFSVPHRTHNYQKLALKHKNHGKAVLFIMIFNVLWCLPLALISVNHSAYSVLCIFVSYTPYLLWCYKNKTGIEEN